jgi:quinoprotein glucose dehydrogenase
VLDRVTGKPVFPIVETPVPPSNVPGEVASKTQPIPTLPRPLAKKVITVDDLNNSSPEENALARQAFAKLYNPGQPFTPLALNQDTLVIPGFGGAWGGFAADHDGIYYGTGGSGAGMSRIVDNTAARQQIGEPGAPRPMGGAQNGYARLDYAFNGYGRFVLPDGKSGLSPEASQGTLNAVDLNTWQYRWTIPLPGRAGGSGPLVTATGLLFIGAGNTLQAYSTADGTKLWQQTLPASGANSPGTYMVDGKQYVIIASGGATAAYIAYALN